jgi:large subunit ribosomal protein L32e
MKFRRVEYWRYKKLGESWRRPRGKHSKVRKYLGPKLNRPLIGYKKKSGERGLHPSGYREVLVQNTSELEGLDTKTQAVRISSTLGARKRSALLEKAGELKLKVLNPGKAKKEKETEASEVEK